MKAILIMIIRTWLLLVICFGNAFGYDRFKEFSEAVRKEDFMTADALLKRGANINGQSPKGKQTPLMQAVLHGKIRAVDYLLRKGADVNIAEMNGYTPMHGAGFQGRPEIAKLLHEHGVPLRGLHDDGFEPIHRACWGPDARHTATVKFFLDAGVPVDEIFYSCMEGSKSDDTKKMIVDYMNANNEKKRQEKLETETVVKKTVDEEFEKMSEAITKEDLKTMDKLIKAGFNVNRSDPQSPLQLAVQQGKEDAVAFLLKHNADVHAKGKRGFTPMHSAAFYGWAEIAKLLYSHSAKLREKDDDGKEPILLACSSRDTDTVKFFLKAGVPIGDIYEQCEAIAREEIKEVLQSYMEAEPNKYIEL